MTQFPLFEKRSGRRVNLQVSRAERIHKVNADPSSRPRSNVFGESEGR